MALFASSNLKKGSTITHNQIVHLTEIYNLDSDAVVLEFRGFCEAYSCLDMADHHQGQQEHHRTKNSAAMGSVLENVDDDEGDGMNDVNEDVHESTKWSIHNYSNHLTVCYQLSGYHNLLRLYWILVTIPVTSCSAERALSRLRIVKNRLRSTMNDDWMNALMIIASEKDLMSKIKNDIIIDNFAKFSDHLKRILIPI